jgi:hypothetical protein
MFGIHLTYVLLLLFVLAVIVGLVVLVAIRASAGMSRPMPPTQVSPDGKWWWDGREWKPVQPPPAPPPSS